MSFFIIACNFDSETIFPDNKTSDYRIKLNKPLKFDSGRWIFGLSEFYMTSDNPQSDPKLLQVMSNVCASSHVEENQRPILRQIPLSATQTIIGIDFHPSFYLPVPHMYLNILHIYITDEKGHNISLGKGTTSYTLHFMEE